MIRHLTNRLTMGLAAVALVVTSALPIPAAALDNRDRRALTLLLGAAALGVIISEANKDKRKSAPAITRRYEGEGDRYSDDRYSDDRYRDDRDWRGGSDRWRHRTVPAECVFSLRGSRGPRDVVSARCLGRYGLHRDLPAECAFDVEAGWDSRRVYGTRCLSRNGYRIAGAY